MSGSLNVLKQRLSEAEEALHRLLIGEQEVSVTVSDFGSTVYAQTDIDKLERYISRLKMTIASLERRTVRGPLFMKF